MAHAHSEPKGPIAAWASGVWTSWENLFGWAGNARNIVATFAILMIGTALTVGVYFLDRQMNLPPFFDDNVTAFDLVVGLMIATAKAGFVLAFFMHMLHEQRLIIRVMGFTAIFFAFMLGLCIWAFFDKPGDYFHQEAWTNPYAAHEGGHHGKGHSDEHAAHGHAGEEHHDTHHEEDITKPTQEAAPPGHGSPNHSPEEH